MEDTGEATTATTDPMGIMDTTERGLPMRLPPPNLDPTLMLRLIRGTATTGTVTDHMDMGTMATGTMDTTERGLPMRPPPNLDPTLMLRLIPGTGTTGTPTDHTEMGTMATGPMVMLTGDKKWTSKTTSNHFLPTHL